MGRLVTYMFYGLSLVFFFSPDLNTSLLFFKKLKSINICLPVICRPIAKDVLVDNYVDIVSYIFAFGIMVIFLIIELVSCDRKDKFEKVLLLWNSDKSSSQVIRFVVYYIGILFIFYFGGNQTEFIYFQF